jgi:hypothetical protein
MTPGRLELRSDGKVKGPATITYNTPFPTANGRFGSGSIIGVVMHTMVGNLPGTVELFNDPAPGGNPKNATSAHFGIAQDGTIHQFGPIGKGWIAWAEIDGNAEWYSIEHADNHNTANPLTPAQIDASAQLVELLSRFAGFPLQVTDSTTKPGYGTHVMGGAAWGGHTCPGPGPRAGQRQAILALAKQIRAAGPTTGGPTESGVEHWQTQGHWSLDTEAIKHQTTPEMMLELAKDAKHDYGPAMKSYIAAGDWEVKLPAGTVLYAPKQ